MLNTSKVNNLVFNIFVTIKEEVCMQNMILGYVLSIVSSFFHTLYIIPRKISKQKPIYYIYICQLVS